MKINNKYGYIRAQESDYSIEFQKQQLIQNVIGKNDIDLIRRALVNWLEFVMLHVY